jgi:hypothetical protein
MTATVIGYAPWCRHCGKRKERHAPFGDNCYVPGNTDRPHLTQAATVFTPAPVSRVTDDPELKELLDQEARDHYKPGGFENGFVTTEGA